MGGAARRPRRVAGQVAIAAAAILVVGTAAVAATGFGWSGDDSDDASGSMPPATATVTRQTLVDRQAETGELSYGGTTTVSARAAGTVTAMAGTGTVVSRGKVMFRVDDKPVILMYGSLPAYRALSVGAEGVDVKQFEQNLTALGYTGFTTDDEYTDATASAVNEWQDDLGLEDTGTVELGRVIYAADQVRIEAHEAAVGATVAPGAAILTYSGTTRVVTVDLEVADQRLAKKGAAVQVTLPSGETTKGKITTAQTVIETGSSEGDAETKIEVTVAVDDQKAFDGLDNASVKVSFTTQERENVLTVPVAALLALAEGGYGVQVVESAGTRMLAVETGLFADGRVEVSGDGLTEGMTVGVPS